MEYSVQLVEYLTEKGKEEYQAKFKDSPLTTVNYPADGKKFLEVIKFNR
jgi:hypothetical protein